MSFHALRIACRNCGSSFLFGGGGVSDMAFWKSCVASCHVCGAQIDAIDAPSVPLRATAPAAPALIGSPRGGQQRFLQSLS
jgi:hypothetical protein